jgi:adenylate kinase
MRIVLVGPPGAGKGTQAAFLAKNLSIPHISTGDLFRANIQQGTELGKRAKAFMDAGDLVPDEVTIGMAEDRLNRPDAAAGFLLDGFPRNESQARALDAYLGAQGLALDGVLDLEVPEAEVVRRIAGRRVCRKDSAHVYHVEYKRPATEGVCDECGGELYQRSDDAEDKVRNRLAVYHRETEPIVDYYKQQGLVQTISALGEVTEVTQRAMDALRAGERQPRAEQQQA